MGVCGDGVWEGDGRGDEGGKEGLGVVFGDGLEYVGMECSGCVIVCEEDGEEVEWGVDVGVY